MANIKDEGAAFLVNVYQLANKQGSATKALVTLMKSINWADKVTVAKVAREFRLGWMAGKLGLKRDDIAVIHDKKPPTDNTTQASDKHRSWTEHQAYRAAVSAWNHAATQAGMPKQRGTGQRLSSPRQTVAKEDIKESTQEIVQDSKGDIKVSVAKVRTTQDVARFARNLAALMQKFQDRNAGVKMDSYRVAFRQFVEAVHALGSENPEA